MTSIIKHKTDGFSRRQYGVALEEKASFLTQGSWGYRYETFELHQQVY